MAMRTITTTDHALLRLLQLSSVSLPVGGYAFSQGMEYAIDAGWVRNAEQVESWLQLQLLQGVARTDLPLMRLAMQDDAEVHWQALNDLSLACRETRELRLTDSAMGEALRRVLKNLGIEVPDVLQQEVSFIVLFAFAAKHWGLAFDAAALGLGWSWLENQVAAATKLVPLGQTQAQQLLNDLQPLLPQAIEIAKSVEEDFIGAGLPALAIASSRHETQYSRLFRS
jgi:urease accessory protein